MDSVDDRAIDPEIPRGIPRATPWSGPKLSDVGACVVTIVDPRATTRLRDDPRRKPFERTGRLRAALPPVVGTDTNEYWALLVVIGSLCILGLVMVLSASSVVSLEETGSSWTYFIKQAEWLAVGLIAAAAALRIDVLSLRRFAKPLFGLCLVGLVAVLMPGIGVTANGATRWIGVGPIQIQPSEIAKLAMLLLVAMWLRRHQSHLGNAVVSIRPMMIALGLVAGLVMLQPNLGTTIVIGVIVFAILFTAGVPWMSLAAYGILGVAFAVTAALASSYRRARVLSFINPWASQYGDGYQLIQSQIGLVGGGVFGVGLGSSRAKWGFLPFAHTDFIYSIIGEELGLIGAVTVIVLFIAIGFLGLRIAHGAPDPFHRYIAVGITTWIVVQAFVNIGAVVGILPITGVPLPFVSYGGTSLLVTMFAAGLLLNVARCRVSTPAEL